MQSNSLNTNITEADALAPLIYFSLFKFPLNLKEVFKFSKVEMLSDYLFSI